MEDEEDLTGEEDEGSGKGVFEIIEILFIKAFGSSAGEEERLLNQLPQEYMCGGGLSSSLSSPVHFLRSLGPFVRSLHFHFCRWLCL